MIQTAALLPIAPLLLLPFFLIFFVVVFPFWLLGVAFLWLLRALVRAVGGGATGQAAIRVNRWFRWVLTFGGFTELYSTKSDSSKSPPSVGSP